MNKLLNILSLLLAASCIVTSAVCCKSSGSENDISGKAGEVIVVASKPVWASGVGEMLKDSLMQECPCLPQREPMYTVVHVPTNGFTRMFKIHRNIIYLNVSDDVTQCRFLVRRNPWAHPQILFYVDAPDDIAAYDLLRENMRTILSELEKIERERVISNTESYCNPQLTQKVESFIGASMVFPYDFSLKKQTKDFMWISYETKYVQQGFLIYRSPVTQGLAQVKADAQGLAQADGMLNPSDLVTLRNKALKANVPGSRDGSYMTTADFLAPISRKVEHDSIQICELRGLWEVENDFMGGPFVSHNFFNRDSTEIVTVEAYVYAPKHDKRIYLRQVESLLYSFKWKKF